MKVSQLSELLNVSEPKVYKTYLRSFIDTALLEKICIALDVNFFEFYAKRFSLENQEAKLLQCEKENSLLRQLIQEKDEKYQLLLSSRRDY